MKRFVSETYIALRLVGFRVACYFLLPAWATFETVTEGMDGASWSALTGFEQSRIIGKCVFAGLFALVAFIDSSVSKARQQEQESREKEGEKIKLGP